MNDVDRSNSTERIRVSIDPRYDLRAANLPREESDIASFMAAWRGAFDCLVEQLGLDDASAFVTTYGSADENDRTTEHRLDEDDETIEKLLWQAAHDMCSLKDDGWQWGELSDRELSAMRRTLGLDINEGV